MVFTKKNPTKILYIMPSLKKPRSDLCVVFLNCIAIERDDVSTGALKKWGKFLKFYDITRNALR